MPVKLFIATPMYGGMCHGNYTTSLTNLFTLCAKNNVLVQLFTLFNESLIQRARNICVDRFLQSDCTHLLFIDADIGFNSNDALGMLSILLSDKEHKYDVLAGTYPKKYLDWEKIKTIAESGFNHPPRNLAKVGNMFSFNPLENGPLTFKGDSLIEVAEAGTGFMMIPRSTFENFIKAYPEQSYRPFESFNFPEHEHKREHAFFDCMIDPDNKVYLSEDFFFCKYVRKMGGRIWILPWITLSHAGTHIFQGSLTESASLATTLKNKHSDNKTQ